MPAMILLIPFLLIRFGLLSFLSRGAIQRAAHFPPLQSGERAAYWVYQIANGALLISLFFLEIQLAPPALFIVGAILLAMGAALLTGSVISFAAPSEDGMNRDGPYRRSRNPMYVAYFIYFIGCVLVTQSLPLLGVVLAFQISAHWIIRAEERWCVQKFGRAYRSYMERVRRYL